MKKLILLLLIVPAVSFAQGLFKGVDKKDEFGDVIGTKLRAKAIGSFANTATLNSDLIVSLVYEKREKETYDEWFERYNSFGFIKEMTKNERKKYFKRYGQQYFTEDNSVLGFINIYLFEYGDKIASLINEYVKVSIKLSDGTKLSYSDKANRRIVIAGNESENSNYKKDERDVYDAIVNATESIDFVIITSSSRYKFTLNPPSLD